MLFVDVQFLKTVEIKSASPVSDNGNVKCKEQIRRDSRSAGTGLKWLLYSGCIRVVGGGAYNVDSLSEKDLNCANKLINTPKAYMCIHFTLISQRSNSFIPNFPVYSNF